MSASHRYGAFNLPSHEEERHRPQETAQELFFKLEPDEVTLGKGKTFLLKTYGCQGNVADSEKLRGILLAMSFTEVFAPEDADLILFNTCAVRKAAEDRVYGEIGRMKVYKETRKDLILGICGCMMQEEGAVARIRSQHPQVDLVFGTHTIQRLPSYLKTIITNHQKVLDVVSTPGDIVEGIPTVRTSDKKAWVDIMHGCDEFCTYCIVPYTRGRERSRSPEAIEREVRELVARGYIEVTLLGQNVNSYGLDFKDRDFRFADLLRLVSATGIPRIRFMTSHPKDLDAATAECYRDLPNLMPCLHLPVQSGSDSILKRMNRKYTRAEYLARLNLVRKANPLTSITTDIIVGFPGETEEDFLATLSLCEEAQFEGAYTFIYSPREGTPAASFPDQVPPDLANERLRRLNEVIARGYLKGHERFLETTQEVFVEGPSDKNPAMLAGYTPNGKLVNFSGDPSSIGRVVKVAITGAHTWYLSGKEID